MAEGKGRPAGVSITVGDPMPGLGIDPDALLADLADRTHREAMQEFGKRPGCTWEGFAGATARPEFEALMVELHTPPDMVALKLSEWDKCGTPFAIVHLTPMPVH